MILGLSGKSKVLLCMQIPQVVYNGIIIISFFADLLHPSWLGCRQTHHLWSLCIVHVRKHNIEFIRFLLFLFFYKNNIYKGLVVFFLIKIQFGFVRNFWYLGVLEDREVPPPFSFSSTPSNFWWQNTKTICADCTVLLYSLPKTGKFSTDYSSSPWKKKFILDGVLVFCWG